LIAQLACARWEKAGKPPGRFEVFWAEAELLVAENDWEPPRKG
jgi:hypothetical protein